MLFVNSIYFLFFYAFHNVILNLLHHSLFKFRIQERDFIPRSGAHSVFCQKKITERKYSLSIRR